MNYCFSFHLKLCFTLNILPMLFIVIIITEILIKSKFSISFFSFRTWSYRLCMLCIQVCSNLKIKNFFYSKESYSGLRRSQPILERACSLTIISGIPLWIINFQCFCLIHLGVFRIFFLISKLQGINKCNQYLYIWNPF